MKVFVSASDALADRSRELIQRMEASGIDSVDKDVSTRPGPEGPLAIQESIRTANAVVCVVDPGAERSPRLQEEWRWAIVESWSAPAKPMISVVVGNAQVPGF